MCIDERRLAVDGRDAQLGEDLEPALLRSRQRVLARLDAREVGPRCPDVETHRTGERIDVVQELGCGDVRPRRRAGDVRAAPTPEVALDERDRSAVVLDRLPRRLARSRAGADHDQVEGHRTSFPSAPTTSQTPPNSETFWQRDLQRLRVADVVVERLAGVGCLEFLPSLRLIAPSSLDWTPAAAAARLETMYGGHAFAHAALQLLRPAASLVNA